MSLAVVGIDFPNADSGKTNRRFEVKCCAPGDPVELRLEPKNPHDENAIAVFSERGIQLGYLPSERAPFIGRLIKEAGGDVVAVFQEELPAFAAIRVRFGGGAPTLPPPRPADYHREGVGRAIRSGGADDFYPDPEGPEWGA